MSFFGTQGIETLVIPVPPGLRPAELTAIVELPVNVRLGTLNVTQDDRTISRVRLPDGDRLPIVVPLDGVDVIDNAVTVTLRSYLVPVEGYCLEPTNPLRFTDVAIRYEGAEIPPATVADFLPPILRKLTILIPARPMNIESEAAARVAMAVVARYGKQNPEVAVLPLADRQTEPVEPSAPMERQIVIREGPEVAVALQGGGFPSLLIGGPPNQLINQARLLSSDLSRLAVSSLAVAGPLKTVPQLPADVTTIRQLGQPGVNATALNPQVSIALDQTRLGRSARNVRVHLRGTYTPLPNGIGGSVVTAINGQTIDQWPVDDTGVIDRWVDIPDRLLQRYTNLGVAINIAGNTGRCGEFQPITLTIDGDSPVQTTRADPPLTAGFQSVPQALMPRIDVGVGEDGFADTRRAVSILVGLQRMSALPMDTVVMPLREAIDSPNPAVLISADGWSDPRITLPVGANESGELRVTGVDGGTDQTTLTLNPAQRFGSLQTVFDGRRTAIVATSNGAPEQVDALLAWLDAAPVRWSRLTGTAVLAPAGRDPVSFGAGSPRPAANAVDGNDDRPYWWLGGGIVAVVIAGAGIWWRTRSKTPGR
ncbi:membrane protein [Mycobacterium antarcticum]|nr:membrane protein [Mycolicibacterium sp. TUM20985]GLP82256.1 membrane protein [Mycolicibacterium sp. TUM20984]